MSPSNESKKAIGQLLVLVVVGAIITVLGWVAVVGFGWMGTQIGAVLARLPWFVTTPLYLIIALFLLLLFLLVAMFAVGAIWVITSSFWNHATRRKVRSSMEQRGRPLK